jgi:O-antigen/teichoic acid export membrane protein
MTKEPLDRPERNLRPSRGLALARESATAAFTRIRASRRLKSEIGWVVLNKAMEFGLMFGLLKVLSNRLGKAGYGEYNLAETAVVFVTVIVLMPVHEAYLRDYHGAADREEKRAAGGLLLRWYAIATVSIGLLVALFTHRLAAWFDVGPWTPLAAGLIFVFERWRYLGQDVLNIQRRRRAWALYNLGYFGLQLSVISLAVTLGPATPSTALLAYAAAAAIFCIPVTGPLIRDVLRAPPGNPSRLPRLIVSFGLPLGALLVFQLVQNMADRYIVKAILDPESVGLYVAAYQVCGIPYILILRVFHDLLTPIAYQRGRDVDDPAQIWSADRLILVGLAAQLLVGFAMLGFYAAFGGRLLVSLTNEQFALPTTTIVILAAARFAQSIAQATQPIFAVHHRLGSMLWFRLFGAVATLVICWYATRAHGLVGAAAGTCAALSAYTLALVFAPRGCWWLVRDVRRRSRLPTA